MGQWKEAAQGPVGWNSSVSTPAWPWFVPIWILSPQNQQQALLQKQGTSQVPWAAALSSFRIFCQRNLTICTLSSNRHSKFPPPGACSFIPSSDHSLPTVTTRANSLCPALSIHFQHRKQMDFHLQRHKALSLLHIHTLTSQPPPFIWGTVKK